MPESSELEYATRITRVQDYIDRHLAEPLGLETLARVACFSPFHFHRVFGFCVGETLREYVLRIRLERAAAMLASSLDLPVGDIALDCGFSSQAAFARAFRAAYGLSASELRKRCKTDRKAGKTPPEESGYPGHEPSAIVARIRRMTMENVLPAQEITIRELPEKTLACLRHVGPYAGDASLFQRLWGEFFAWAGPRGLFVPGQSEMICAYHDNPGVTEPDKLRLSLGITVPPGTPVGGRISLLTLPGGRWLCARFELDTTQYAAAWAAVGAWFTQSGYQCADGPAYECYLSGPEERSDGRHIVEIRMQVIPL